MYARLQTMTNRPADEGMVPMIADMIAAHPGFAGLVMLAGEGDDRSATMVSLWQTREDAELASERSAAIRGPRPFELDRDEIYEVDADEAGQAAGAEPTAAFFGEFDGPLSPGHLEAARFAGTERIGPALRTVPGLVRVVVLWHPTERRMVVVHLATSVQALHAGGEVVMSTKLLPGEDPDLLPGPDHITMMRVAGYRAASVPVR
jgi:hypothetical protein